MILLIIEATFKFQAPGVVSQHFVRSSSTCAERACALFAAGWEPLPDRSSVELSQSPPANATNNYSDIEVLAPWCDVTALGVLFFHLAPTCLCLICGRLGPLPGRQPVEFQRSENADATSY